MKIAGAEFDPAVLEVAITKAQERRKAIGALYPRAGATPNEVLRALQLMRPYLDELEQLLMLTRRMRGMADEALIQARGAADDAWDSAARGKGSAVRDGGPRERYAHFNLEAVEERITLREAEQYQLQASATFDAVQMLYRGADGMRHDLHVMVRSATFESSLER